MRGELEKTPGEAGLGLEWEERSTLDAGGEERSVQGAGGVTPVQAGQGPL